MLFEYETDRLILRLLNETDAEKTLLFYKTGNDYFNRFEPVKNPGFLTLSYQASILRSEYSASLAGTHMRFYIFEKDRPDFIIGTISFQNILSMPYYSCIIGYKFLQEYQHKGYATESCSRLITAIFEEMKLHRIEAFVLPDNYASIGLLLRLGFSLEGTAKSVIKLNDGFVDHNRFVLINPFDLAR